MRGEMVKRLAACDLRLAPELPLRSKKKRFFLQSASRRLQSAEGLGGMEEPRTSVRGDGENRLAACAKVLPHQCENKCRFLLVTASRRRQPAEIKATSTPGAETDSPHHGEPGA